MDSDALFVDHFVTRRRTDICSDKTAKEMEEALKLAS